MDSSNKITPTFRDTVSPKPEDFPKNVIRGAYDNLDHYAGVQYQLLWEDFVSSLREGITLLKRYFQSGDKKLKNEAERFVHYYTDVQVNKITGGALRLVFPNLYDKALIPGSLLYLSHDKFESITTVIIEDVTDENVVARIRDIMNPTLHPAVKFDVVENKAYFGAYEPFLKCLKTMTNWNSSSLIDYILGISSTVKPPNYMQHNTIFEFNVYNSNKVFVTSPVMNISKWPSASDLGLNDGQRKALHLALTHDVAIIQGPPGTGKTFLGVKIIQTLIQNRRLWDSLGPIVLICFTNHALDQFLEKVVDMIGLKPRQVVRFGSRSQSMQLEPFNILNLRQRRKVKSDLRKYYTKRTRIEKLQTDAIKVFVTKQAEAYRKILDVDCLRPFIDDKHYQSLVKYCNQRGQAMVSWLGEALCNMMEKKAAKTEPVGTKFRFQFDNSQQDTNNSKNTTTKADDIVGQMAAAGWQVKGFEMQIINTFNEALQCDDKTSVEDLKDVDNVWDFNAVDTWRMYTYWLNLWLQKYADQVQRQINVYENNNLDIAMERAYRDDLLLSDDTVIIGMTTTGAALNHKLLNSIRPGIVIVEEAAEVTESHVVTALTENCKHLIMIGDHKQLRPHSNCHDLAVNNFTEISFFERMIENGVPYATLTMQHRMHPHIAELLVPNIYKKLECHPSVYHYEKIRGIESSIFFLSHEFKDKREQNSSSFINIREARFAISLCRYLRQQNYDSSKITMLAAYKGQMLLMKNMVQNDVILNGVHITTIDAFQGEENDIIILSLVRSNAESKSGFLTIENRICVALSRARMGLYAIGNFKMLGVNRVWTPILQSLRKRKLLGPMLRIFCQNHPKFMFNVKVSDDFKQVPNGGCGKLCDFVYPKCGHRCTLFCHQVDVNHDRECSMMCDKLCCRGHRCKQLCCAQCGKCEESVNISFPGCEHTLKGICGDIAEDIVCKLQCEMKLPCGHPCSKLCGESCDTDCSKILYVKLPRCSHEIFAICGSDLTHVTCRRKCTQLRLCKHPCVLFCHINNPKIACTCGKKCNNKCHRGHFFCYKACGEPCGNCTVQVNVTLPMCGHKVKGICGEISDTTPCKVPCERKLPCGHKVNGICGEMSDTTPCKVPCERKLPCGRICNKLCAEICDKECSKVLHVGLPECNHRVKVKCGSDMTKILCKEKCPELLPCQHPCMLPCHRSNKTIKCDCKMQCEKKCLRGHVCRKSCCVPCGKCQTSVSVTLSSCGHKLEGICGDITDSTPCELPCEKKLLCGHTCTRLCKETCGTHCRSFLVEKRLDCGHKAFVLCGSDVANVKCQEKCNKLLSCGHYCTMPIHQVDGVHICKCNRKCDKKCVRGHCCGKECGEPCGKCDFPVKVSGIGCGHSYVRKCSDVTDITFECELLCEKKLACGHTCQRFCNEVCSPICVRVIEKKLPFCNHTVVSICGEDSSNVKCKNSCNRILPCGHNCMNICSVPCGPCAMLVEIAHPVCSHTVTIPCKYLGTDAAFKTIFEIHVCSQMYAIPCYQAGATGSVPFQEMILQNCQEISKSPTFSSNDDAHIVDMPDAFIEASKENGKCLIQ